MKASIFSTLLVLELASGTNFCDEKLRKSVTDAVELGNGTLLSTTDGVQYPNGTFWKEGEGSWSVCPCLFHSCIRVCEQGFANDIISHFGQNDDVHETIYWLEIFEKNATPKDVFLQVPLAKCSEMADILEKDTFKIFSNGQLKVENQTLHPEQYCVHFMDGSSLSVQVIRCMEGMIEEHQLKFILYPPFFVLSSIFLILTVFAFVITPEFRSFHAKCVVCHSACMAVAFIALTVNYLHRITEFYKICFTIGYTILYSFLASMFWLNAMSIDIYLTFKGFVRTQGSHIKKLTIYSFGTPMAIVAVAMAFNLANNENSAFNAKIGEKLCWIESDSAAILIFLHGPTLILLLANVALFSATAFNVTRTRQESARAMKQANSRVHLTRKQEKQRLKLYLKVSLLMGFTWITEVLNSVVGGDDLYWYFTDIVNASRGILIFWLFVLANKKIRKSLLDKFWKSQ